MKRPAPLIVLSQSLLLVAVALAVTATVVSGGVVASQAAGGVGWRSVDWSIPLWSGAILLLLILVGAMTPIGWIDDREIKRMEEQEYREEISAALKDETRWKWFILKMNARTGAAGLVLGIAIVLKIMGWTGQLDKNLDLNASIPNGGNGTAIAGFTFGSFHLLGKDWTGVELAIILPLLAGLVYMLWSGFAHIVKANRSDR